MDNKTLLQRLERVVGIPSVSSTNPALDTSNKAIIDYLANEFSDLGFECELIPYANDSKFNLIASFGSGPGGLVLAGHTDTVPYDEDLWTVDPFKLNQRDNKFFGLGVTDMKGFFPLVMEAVTPLLDKPFREPLIVLATADEETSMEGARCLAEMGRPRARSAVIG
ncbi:MAG: M20/M25/M40 family metallo-hydrolase, partial [Pseudomonadales bacterium]|nr:M20/M25/M40 family metallo-hydrolase [Pseudomonadales bacterium]